MKKIFLDTNILIDLLADRKPFSKYALAVFKKAEEKQLRLYTSSHSIATTYYFLSKHHEDKALRILIQNLISRIHVIPVFWTRKSLWCRLGKMEYKEVVIILQATRPNPRAKASYV